MHTLIETLDVKMNETILDSMNTRDAAVVDSLNPPEGVIWTGWKARHNFYLGGNTVFWSEGLVSQWIDTRTNCDGKYWLLNMPNMKLQLLSKGAVIDVLGPRVGLYSEDTEQTISEGLRLLLLHS